MGSLRNAYLDVLGIDRWVPKGAVEAAEPVLQIRTPESRAVTPPPESPVPLRVAVPATRVAAPAYQRGPLAADWAGLRQQVAACTACEQLCGPRTQTVFGVGNT